MRAQIRRTSDGGRGYEAVFERHLSHPPPRVWVAVGESGGIATWFTRNELHARPGGRYRVHHDHVGISVDEEVLRHEPPRTFEHTWGKRPDEAGIPDRVRWEVHPDADGSRLVVTYRFRDLDNAAASLAGWDIWLDILEAVLSGEPRAAHGPPRGTFEDGTFREIRPGEGHWRRHAEALKVYEEQIRRLRAAP
ncbi:MAG: SRPBCC domain-containing protein [Methanobacteriota archaeon]